MGSALASARNLERLAVQGNMIKDLTPVSRLRGLIYLRLDGNPLESLVPLAALVNLRHLDISSTDCATLDVCDPPAQRYRFKLLK